MELVYLWVENYKNIHHQGFNFSPRFHCEYNDKTKELTINENNDYIPNFFGENINITAIVGKNGSGKSSILECIKIAMEFFFMEEKEEFFYELFEYENFEKPYILIIEQGNIFYNISIHSPKGINKTFIENNINNNRKIFLLNSHHLYTFETNSFPLELILNFSSFLKKNINFFNPNRIIINLTKWLNQETCLSHSIKEQLEYIVNTLYEEIIKEIHKEKRNDLSLNIFLEIYKNDLSTKDKSDIESLIIIQEYIHKNDLSNFNEFEHMFYILDFSKGLAKDLQIFILALNNFNLIDIFDSRKKELYTKKEYPSDFGMSYNSLSNGEKHLLSILLSIQNFTYNKKKHENLIIFLDEPDNELHPEWQRTIISELINTCKFNLKIHFILTTHSPFLLSDIPKQNIIFLDTDDEGKCKVVDGLNEKKQTFGANIHTLLSDNFFMEKGLMGEFAKSKINKIINFHKEVEEENRKEKSNLTPFKTRYKELKTKFWQTQSIIGEDYLKQVVKNHLRDIENILLGFNEAKKEEIKRLRAEADRLENM